MAFMYFASTDDLWVYVNNDLIVDFGGTHPLLGQTINFDTLQNFERTQGSTYNLQ